MTSPFGYDTETVQTQFQARDENGPAAFLLPHLSPGQDLLDCGCGPGTVTLGLARYVTPGRVVGCDLADGMIERARAAAGAAELDNASFETADILALPFPDETFDVTFSAAVTEHLENPVAALKELARVTRPGGIVAVTRTDWSATLASPDDEAVARFFTLLEQGFNARGGSMNTGRHLRGFAQAAGLQAEDYFASYINGTTPELVRSLVSDYVQWMENMPIFEDLVATGVTTRAELDEIATGMWSFADRADAFLAVTICRLIARKRVA